MFRLMLEGLLNLIWPPRSQCLSCLAPLASDHVQGLGQGTPEAEWFCRTCLSELTIPTGRRFCCNCMRPFLGEGRSCRECQQGSEYGRVWALGLHKTALREAIHHLKFNGRDQLALLLGQRLGERIEQPYDLLVPMPLHRARERERGYNQAELIAEGIARALRVPLSRGVLTRLRSTGHQAKLERGERLRNLQGAFGVNRTPAPWTGKRVLLVDDVLTTGATATAATAVLHRSGAAAVDLAVLAVSTTPVSAGADFAKCP